MHFPPRAGRTLDRAGGISTNLVAAQVKNQTARGVPQPAKNIMD